MREMKKKEKQKNLFLKRSLYDGKMRRQRFMQGIPYCQSFDRIRVANKFSQSSFLEFNVASRQPISGRSQFRKKLNLCSLEGLTFFFHWLTPTFASVTRPTRLTDYEYSCPLGRILFQANFTDTIRGSLRHLAFGWGSLQWILMLIACSIVRIRSK